VNKKSKTNTWSNVLDVWIQKIYTKQGIGADTRMHNSLELQHCLEKFSEASEQVSRTSYSCTRTAGHVHSTHSEKAATNLPPTSTPPALCSKAFSTTSLGDEFKKALSLSDISQP
jgi:hypothetical protein